MTRTRVPVDHEHDHDGVKAQWRNDGTQTIRINTASGKRVSVVDVRNDGFGQIILKVEDA